MTTNDEYAAYLERRAAASDAFVAGDVAPLLAVSTATAPASIFGPAGTVVEGPEAVNTNNSDGAAHFAGADRNDLEVAHGSSDGDLGYWTGVQRSLVTITGQDEPVPFDLRVTELYRREADGWKLFHRHADPLKEPRDA